jgi:hypothetical protein
MAPQLIGVSRRAIASKMRSRVLSASALDRYLGPRSTPAIGPGPLPS